MILCSKDLVQPGRNRQGKYMQLTMRLERLMLATNQEQIVYSGIQSLLLYFTLLQNCTSLPRSILSHISPKASKPQNVSAVAQFNKSGNAEDEDTVKITIENELYHPAFNNRYLHPLNDRDSWKKFRKESKKEHSASPDVNVNVNPSWGSTVPNENLV